MAHPYCSGAGHFWVGVGVNQQPAYLGTCEDRPNFEGRPKFEAIMNDLYGGAAGVPFDFSYLGQVDVVTVGSFTRFNWPVFRAMTTIPNPAGTFGTFQATDIGTIMGLEGFAAPLWVTFPYSAKTAMQGMDVGRHYLSTILFDPHGLQAGTRVSKISLIWLCFAKYDPQTQRSVLFDANMAGLPNPD